MYKTKITTDRNRSRKTPVTKSYHTSQLRHTPADRHSSKRLKVFFVIVVLFFGIAGISKLDNKLSAQAIPEIRSGINGYCLDVHNNTPPPNAVVDTWSCNNSPAQDWTISGSAIRHSNNGCLDVDNGNKVVLNQCSGSASQSWTEAIGGYENTTSGLCLHVPNYTTNIQLDISSCDQLTKASETWTAEVSRDSDQASTSSSPCTSGTEGEKVACEAATQWSLWQSVSPSHETLLTNYTDGNAYEEWCADFVSYIYSQAGYPFTQGERNGWDEYDANNIQYMGFTWHPASGYTPQPGDVAFFNYPGGHVEIVAVGGEKPIFIYGDSATTDPTTNNGQMDENSLTSDGSLGQLTYYLSPN